MRIATFILSCCLVSSVAVGQKETSVLSDLDRFLEHVSMHHPVALAADLRPSFGAAAVRQSQGAFDPRVGGSIEEKQFDDKQYYSLAMAGLRIPTWVGIDLNAGFEQNRGVFLNPENTMPDGGLAQAGISVPLGRGLILDDRRTALKKAKLLEKATPEERKAIRNDLMAEAGMVYLEWQLAVEQEKVFREALSFAAIRMEAVKQAAELGDRPSIDTLEAGIQVMDRQNNLLQAQLYLRNTTANLSLYLWKDGIIPLEPNPDDALNFTFPIPDTPDPSLVIGMDSLIALHPELRLAAFKPQMLKLDERLRAENLKPTVNLKYNFINEPLGDNPFAGLSAENYSRGLQVAIPLFLRHERGALQMARVVLKEAEFELTLKNAELKMKATMALNDWQVTQSRALVAEKMSRDYLALSEGEKQLFDGGESSLFMVNARETAYISAEVKRLELIIKNKQASLKAMNALGLLTK